MSLYLAPSFLDSGDTMRTRWMRAPLPFPGTDLVQREAFAGLEGSDLGFDQFKFIGTSSYPTSNICGTLRYRRFHTRRGEAEDAVFLSDNYGIGVYAGAPESSLTYDTWEQEVDYRFVNERDEDYVDPETGEHEERWLPVVQIYFVVDSNDGPPFGLSFNGVGVDATEKKYQYYNVESEDGEEVVKLVNHGSTTLSLLIDHDYFKIRIQQWENLPSSARRRSNGGLSWGGVVATSDSKEGVFCYIGGGQWYAMADLSEVGTVEDGEFYERGWSGGVKVNVPHTRRKNAPVVHDNKVESADSDIYRLTVSEAILAEEIFVRRWLDDCGTYDPAGANTFNGMGWRPMEPASLDEVATVPPAAQGGASTGQLLSADGKTYRVTLEVMGYDEGEFEATVQKTVLVNVESGDPGDFDLRLPDSNTASISSVRVASIQRQAVGGGWESITETAGVISNMPGNGVLLLCIAKARRGSRWGFPQYYDAGWPDDVEEHGVSQSNDMRFFKKQLFRHKAKATTQT